jgi:hypothetical protein
MKDELILTIKDRRLTPMVRNWVDFWCDHLGACFRAQRSAAPHVRLGIMVMYLAESVQWLPAEAEKPMQPELKRGPTAFLRPQPPARTQRTFRLGVI